MVSTKNSARRIGQYTITSDLGLSENDETLSMFSKDFGSVLGGTVMGMLAR